MENSTIAEKNSICPKCKYECIKELQLVLEDKDKKKTFHCLQCWIKKQRADIPELLEQSEETLTQILSLIKS